MRKARDTILRLTLKKLRMLKPGLESSKVSVRLEMGGQCKSIPNPRFVNGGGAEFYGCKLQLQATQQHATIIILGSFPSDTQPLGCIPVDISDLRQDSVMPCEFSNNFISLSYNLSLLNNYSPPADSDSQCKSDHLQRTVPKDIDLMLPINDLTFKPSVSVTSKRKQKTIMPNNRSYLSNLGAETRSDSINENAVIFSKRDSKTLHRQNSSRSFIMSESGDFRFIDPVTHSPSPESSSVKRGSRVGDNGGVNFEINPVMSASRLAGRNVRFPTRDLIQYGLVCFGALILGTMVKQGI